MEGKWKNLTGYMIAAFLFLSTLFYSLTASSEDPGGEISFEIVFDEETLNLSLDPNAITFQGWVNSTGYYALPLTIHLYVSSDLGDAYLSQYEFTFQTPTSYAYTGLISNEAERNSTYTYCLIMGGTIEQGGIQSTISPISQIIPAYYWEEEEKDIKEHQKPDTPNDIPFIFALPFLLVVLGIYIKFVKPRYNKSAK